MKRIKAWSHYPPGRTADFTGINPLKTYVNFQSRELEFIFFFSPVSILLRFSLDNYHLLTFSGWAPSKRIRYTHGFYPVWLSSGLKKSQLLEDALTLSERMGVMRQSSQWEKPPEHGARTGLSETCPSWILPPVPFKPLMFPHLPFPASVVHHYHHYLTPLSLHRAHLAKSQVSIKQSTYFCLHSCGWTFAEGKKPSSSMTTFILKSWFRITRGCSTFVQFSHHFSSFSTFPDHYFRAFPTSILASFLPDITLSASDFTSHSVEKKENLPERNT